VICVSTASSQLIANPRSISSDGGAQASSAGTCTCECRRAASRQLGADVVAGQVDGVVARRGALLVVRERQAEAAGICGQP